MCISYRSTNVDELEQFLETLKPVNSVPVKNEVYKTSSNDFIVHIKCEPAIDLLSDDAEDEFGDFSREGGSDGSAEPEDYAEALPNEGITSKKPVTAYENPIDYSQNSIGDSTFNSSKKNASSVEPEANIDAVLHLIASEKLFQVCAYFITNMSIFYNSSICSVLPKDS